MTQPEKRRVLSGMRPTGKLHLGNLVGALQRWIELQDHYDCFHFVADWHMLTTGYSDTSELKDNTQEMVTDWLGAGLDPKKATFFVQSRLPEHAELHLLFSMITPLGWLERVPSYKEQLANIRDHDLHMYGFLGYPVLQAADILMYKATVIPVGEDQAAHVELAREIARRFNLGYGRFRYLRDGSIGEWLRLMDTGFDVSVSKYVTHALAHANGNRNAAIPANVLSLIKKELAEGTWELRWEFVAAAKAMGLLELGDIFPEPVASLTPARRLPGTDGRKMSKSYSNAIYLSDPPEVVSKKLATMITDPARKRRTDKGNPDVCPVFDLHKVFSTAEDRAEIDPKCRAAEIGCLDCKHILAGNINVRLKPIQERRVKYEENPAEVWNILDEGTECARKEAQKTMREVREAMKMGYANAPAGTGRSGVPAGH